MKPLYQALAAGVAIALLHSWILVEQWTLWDISIVSVSSLSTGVFFILSMIFRSTIQDYKQADIAIVQIRGKMLFMQEMNTLATEQTPLYDPQPFRQALMRTTRTLRKFVENNVGVEKTYHALSALRAESKMLRDNLQITQGNMLLKLHDDLLQSFCYLTYMRTHNFPLVGYVFLWFFVGFIILLQVFSQTENLLLDTLFLFSLSSILVFFVSFIRDLDFPFQCHLACFTLDTRPLKQAEHLLQRSDESTVSKTICSIPIATLTTIIPTEQLTAAYR